ncbi:unnamed protein product [Cochlearia groenlandica]
MVDIFIPESTRLALFLLHSLTFPSFKLLLIHIYLPNFSGLGYSGLLTWFDDADGRNHWRFIQLRSPKGRRVGYRIPNRAPSALNCYCAYLVYQRLGQLLT